MTLSISESARVPDAEAIAGFRDRPGVWLTFAGSAFLLLYGERLIPLQLKPHWIIAMAIISERPHITQSALARALRINRASAMALSVTLEDSGYVLREALPGRKQTALALTGLGEQKLVEAYAVSDDLVVATMDWLDAETRSIFLNVLKRITDLANRLPSRP
jgi:DNA-binding MarR family transcriptional regulator